MTGITSNIDELIAKFSGISQEDIDVSPALLVGVNAAAGQMRQRIFNEGKDAQGQPLGSYTGRKKRFSPKQKLTPAFQRRLKNSRIIGPENQLGEDFEFSEYEILRLSEGRQVRYKDLERTGTLRRGIVPIDQQDQSSIVSKTRVVCSIPNDNLFKIARYQEEQVGKIRGGGKANIFTLSNSERDLMKENIREALKQLYVRVFNA